MTNGQRAVAHCQSAREKCRMNAYGSHRSRDHTQLQQRQMMMTCTQVTGHAVRPRKHSHLATRA
eukprot:CAMPEP_0115881322 /NCGR_PEP_ID=MMETSP0287-20121206/28370_1 /TAXON_ID=412157 /ORGANISM="Chrysochromulina rotalis, Strain UIO044" /LENGTH=63 /DNA_ID=CAMNT_0003337247 /DNA_START=1 /DNA_END=189 /DNA_ORIENTATION=-